MPALRSVIFAGGLAAFAQAFTQPTTASWGPLLQPDLTHPVTQGETFEVTWDPQSHPTDGVSVSLVLCHGPSTNCQTAPTAIVEGVPAAQKSYSWSVPCDLAPGTQSTDSGYGMLIIVDGTGEFQYSTQFSVLAGSKCGSSTSSTPSSNSTSSTPTKSLGGWTSVVGGGQGGYSTDSWNQTTSVTVVTSTASISVPTSIASATGIVAGGSSTGSYSFGGPSSTAEGATPTAPTASASASAFAGAGVKVQAGGLLGLVGAFAVFAL